MAKLQDIAKRAKSDLAWLAANHLVYKTSQHAVTRPAKEALVWPEQTVAVTLEMGSPCQVRKHWERTVAYFRDFCACAGDSPSDAPGHYLNKAAIVYAVAVLEGFLPEAFYAKFREELEGASLHSHVKQIQGRKPFGNLGTSKPTRTVYVADFEQYSHDALFLAALRNAIVHNQGFVDKDFLESVGFVPNRAKVQIWDHGIWATKAAFGGDYSKTTKDVSGRRVRRQVCLDVAKVVIPYLHHALAFVGKTAEEFRKAPLPKTGL